MKKNAQYGNILLFTIPSTMSTGHFNEYFIQNSKKLFLIILPLTNQPPKVQLNVYKNGYIDSTKNFYLYRGNNLLLRYLFFLFYYWYIVFFALPKKTVVFATTPQYCFLSSIFRLFRDVQVVYHVGDYYPGSHGIMRLYQWLIHFYNARLQYVVYCSSLLEKILKPKKISKDWIRQSWVYGVKMIKKNKQNTNSTLGFVGVLRPGQGIEIILETLTINPKLSLEIIGRGPFTEFIQDEIRQRKLSTRVKMYGLIQDEKTINKIVSRWQIGLAPYDPSQRNMTYYGDPSKVKFYLEYRLPVIMTKITYMSKDINRYHAGIAIDFSVKSLLEAITQIRENYGYYLDGLEKLVKKYEYNKLYDSQFKFLKKV